MDKTQKKLLAAMVINSIALMIQIVALLIRVFA